MRSLKLPDTRKKKLLSLAQREKDRAEISRVSGIVSQKLIQKCVRARACVRGRARACVRGRVRACVDVRVFV